MSKRTNRVSRIITNSSKITLALMSVSCVQFVVAETATDVQKAKPSEGLEVIIVTATKREKNIQEVPISMTALSASRLKRLGVKEISNLENVVPNLDFGNTHTNDNPAIIIRGISASAGNIGFEAGVGVYIDGVYMGRNSSLNQPLTDIDLVEVLRGPQGTLFGKNTTVGALNIKTRRPSDELEGSVQVELGNYNLLRTRARVSGPLIKDKLLGKISVFSDDRDGFEKNLKEGASDALDENQQGMRGELLYLASDALDVSLRWDWLKNERKIMAWSIDENDTHGLSFEGNKPHVINQDDTDEVRTIKGTSLTADYRFDSGFTFTSITGVRELDISIFGDQDFLPAQRLSIDKVESFEQFSQELRIASPDNRDFKFVSGAFYYQQDATSRISNIVNEFFPVIGVDAGFVAGLGTPLGFAAWQSETDLTNTNRAEVETTSTALFFDSSYDITEQLSVLFGVRYTDEDKTLNYSQQGINLLIPSYAAFDDSRNDSEVSPSLGMTYAYDEDINLYTKVSRGFKSGGWNATTIGNPSPFGPIPLPSNEITESQLNGIKFDSEKLTNYEIGAKTLLLDNKVRLNTALFYIDYEDMQLSVFKGLEGSITTNAGAARSRGLEIELEATATDNLNLAASIGYSDAVFTQFDPNETVDGDELDGIRLSGPKLNANFSVTYSTELEGVGYLSAGLDYSYKSKSYGKFSNVTGTEFGSTSLLNGLVRIETDDNWDVSLWAKNLLDKDNIITRQADSNLAIFNVDFVNYAAPRTFGMTFTYNYN
jgi:iron complex outermembrane receptor protein